MSTTYEAQVYVRSGSTFRIANATCQTDSPYSARKILEAQYGARPDDIKNIRAVQNTPRREERPQLVLGQSNYQAPEKHNNVTPFLVGAATGFLAARATESNTDGYTVVIDSDGYKKRIYPEDAEKAARQQRFDAERLAANAQAEAEETRRENRRQARIAAALADTEAKWNSLPVYEAGIRNPADTYWFPTKHNSYATCWEIVATGLTASVGELFKFTGKTCSRVSNGEIYAFQTEQKSFEDTFKVSPYFSKNELEIFTANEERKITAEHEEKNALLIDAKTISSDYGKSYSEIISTVLEGKTGSKRDRLEALRAKFQAEKDETVLDILNFANLATA